MTQVGRLLTINPLGSRTSPLPFLPELPNLLYQPASLTSHRPHPPATTTHDPLPTITQHPRDLDLLSAPPAFYVYCCLAVLNMLLCTHPVLFSACWIGRI